MSYFMKIASSSSYNTHSFLWNVLQTWFNQMFSKFQECLTDLLQANFFEVSGMSYRLVKRNSKRMSYRLVEKNSLPKKFEMNVLQTCAQVCKTFHKKISKCQESLTDMCTSL